MELSFGTIIQECANMPRMSVINKFIKQGLPSLKWMQWQGVLCPPKSQFYGLLSVQMICGYSIDFKELIWWDKPELRRFLLNVEVIQFYIALSDSIGMVSSIVNFYCLLFQPFLLSEYLLRVTGSSVTSQMQWEWKYNINKWKGKYLVQIRRIVWKKLDILIFNYW